MVLPMKKWVIGLLACCSVLGGCNTNRIAKLEKENADLKARIEQQSATTAYDLQAKCSKDARSWFSENWLADKDTILLNYTNHYSAKQNKCFILVEYHYHSHLAAPGGDSWTNDINLYDVYENAKYAQFDENHYEYWKPKYSTGDEVITCEVSGTKCKTGQEFNHLVGQYLND